MGNKIAGQSESDRMADAKTWSTDVASITGGAPKSIDEMTGPEVIAPFGLDPLGKSKSK